MFKLKQFDYALDKKLIAQEPCSIRDQSKLMVLNRQTGEISHHHFYDLPQLLDNNDCLVRNDSKVIPARLKAQKKTGGQIEVLLIKRQNSLDHNLNNQRLFDRQKLFNQQKQLDQQVEIWECLTKPGIKPGQKLIFNQHLQETLTAECLAVNGYIRIIRFNQPHQLFLSTLKKIGQTPLPPYIHNSSDENKLRRIYQAIYAEKAGSVAAHTAGFHFTANLIQKIFKKGLQIETVTLHIGLGTFQPVKCQNITDHQMHAEYYSLNQNTAQALNQAKKNGKKILAVGTTSLRVLETCAQAEKNSSPFRQTINQPTKNAYLQANCGETDLFIYPGCHFKFVDKLITNFHLPKSTLLMLLAAFVSYPNTKNHFTDFAHSLAGKAYQEAIARKYRFYSFGDAMMII